MEKVSGKASFKARSRIMLLLGEQLITDETAAISELIKNAYDADATKVKIELKNVSKKDHAEITVTDNGHGMTRKTLLSSWLEIGTISKAKIGKKKRVSELLKRPYLGEKGLGRLSIHKIGKKTKLTTRRIKSNTEVSLVLDWSAFEDYKKFLEDIDIKWEEGAPKVFSKDVSLFSQHGTRIHITNLHRQWTKEMIRNLKQFIATFQSPFSSLTNFEVEVDVTDPIDTMVKVYDVNAIFDTANYIFKADVDRNGYADTSYSYFSKLYPKFKRKSTKKHQDLKPSSKSFPQGRKPHCGPFKFHIYCWDLDPKDKKAAFSEGITYETMVKPLTGFKLFRDGFRVLPYGTEDNDWLGMDKKRIVRFQENVSRSQVIGFVDISSSKNQDLVDKSDREGLIDNDSFQDFKELVLSALQYFQTERNNERLKIKKIKREEVRLRALREEFTELTNILKTENIRPEVRKKISQQLSKTNKLFTKILEEAEEPLIAAASIGLTYMIPTHEAARNIQESYQALNDVINNKVKNPPAQLKIIINQLKDADDILKGIVKISQTIKDEERFSIKSRIDSAVDLMRQNLKRNNVRIETNYRIDKTIMGSPRLITLMLLNFIDNSIFWLNSINTEKRIKIIFADFDLQHYAIIFCDNGPGFQDDIELLSRPFVTRKTKGMGLGLYICDRIAEMHNGKLKILNEFDFPGLLSGANIAFLIPKEGLK